MSTRPKRVRKAVQKMTYEVKEVKAFTVPKGEGITLRDIPTYVEKFHKLKSSNPNVGILHRVLYGRAGKARAIKGNILQFSGLVGGEKVEQKVMQKLQKVNTKNLKEIIDIFEVDRSAKSFEDGKVTKENLIDRLLSWLRLPKAPAPKKSKSKSTSKSRSKAPEKRKDVDVDDQADGRGSPKKKKRKSIPSSPKRKRISGKMIKDKLEQVASTRPRVGVSIKTLFAASEFMLTPAKAAEARKKLALQKKRKAQKKKNTKQVKTTKAKIQKRKRQMVLESSSSSDDEGDSLLETMIKAAVKKVLKGFKLEELTIKKVYKHVVKALDGKVPSDKIEKSFVKSAVKSFLS